MRARINLGTGWKFVNGFDGDDLLIVKAIESLGSNRQRFSWVCLDLANGKRCRLPTNSSLPIGVSAPGYWPSKREMVYETVDGIGSFNFRTGQEALLIPVRNEEFRILKVVFSPGVRDEVAYVLGQFEDSPGAVRAKLNSAGGPISLPIKAYYVYLWSREADRPREITSFQDLPGAFDVDWDRRNVVALLGSGRLKELVRVELDSGSRSSVLKSNSIAAVSVSPQGTILTWGHENGGIAGFFEDTGEIQLTADGWYPTYSPNKSDFAFTVRDCEVWLARSGATERVASVPPEVGSNSFDRVVWNPAGNRFAVFLSGGGGGNCRPLLIADCVRRELLLVEDIESVGTTGERIWIPRAEAKSCICDS